MSSASKAVDVTLSFTGTTAIPQISWPMAAQAASGEPIATVAPPAPKANSSVTSSAWFV